MRSSETLDTAPLPGEAYRVRTHLTVDTTAINGDRDHAVHFWELDADHDIDDIAGGRRIWSHGPSGTAAGLTDALVSIALVALGDNLDEEAAHG